MASSDIIEKVRKLLALANSSNANEAAAAAAAANRMIDEHRLSMGDVTQNPEESIVEDDGFIYETGRVNPWKASLVSYLVQHYGCAYYNKADFSTGRQVSRFRLVGRKSDIEIAKYMFNYIANECQRLADRTVKGLGHVQVASYCHGFISGVNTQLRASRIDLAKTTEPAAMIKLNTRGQEADVFMHKQHLLRSSKAHSSAQINPALYNSGFQAGKNVRLDGVGSIQKNRLLGQ